jgi:hypothetical protein
MSTVPQPLTGSEIKRGIAVRMTQGLPEEVAEKLRPAIILMLGKTCSLLPSSAYAKFNADWKLAYRQDGENFELKFWVDYELDDFGRVTRGGIGTGLFDVEESDGMKFSGTIDEMPPDRFRRETDQTIPKPTELKPKEPEKSTFSRSLRGSGKRRQV